MDAPRFMRTDRPHNDLKIKTASEVIKDLAMKHGQRLANYRNSEASRLLNTAGRIRRLKMRKPNDLAPTNELTLY